MTGIECMSSWGVTSGMSVAGKMRPISDGADLLAR